MSRITTWSAIVLGVCLLGAPVLAHQVTYKGTVISAEPQGVTVTVMNEKTKKPEPMTFDLDKGTKILRGDAVVTFAAARIQKGESIAVTVDHDADERLALVVRLDARK